VGGLQSQPVDTEARLFAWDVERGEKVWEGVPVPGERAVTAVVFDDDGMLWELVNGWIFSFDPATREVTRLERFAGAGEGARWGRGREWASSPRMVTSMGMPPVRFSALTAGAGALTCSTMGDACLRRMRGDLYFVTSSELFRVRVPRGGE